MKSIFKLIRVYQWIKSGFIFLPFIFSPNLHNFFSDPSGSQAVQDLIRLGSAFFGFSFLASFGYVINDWRDRELDRADPRKNKRPLASGAVSPFVGFLTGIILFLMAYLFASTVSVSVVLIFGIYTVLNIFFYSNLGKRIILLDVFIIASGFVLRVLVGAYAIGIEASPWLISATFFIALFLGFSKRYYEVRNAPEEVLLGGIYNEQSLQNFISISAALSIMNYSMYCILGTHADANLIWTIPLVVLGIFRYYILSHGSEILSEGNPSDVLLSDKYLILIIFTWMLLCAFLIMYFQPQFS